MKSYISKDKVKGYVPLTHKTDYCYEMAENINKDYPGTAIVHEMEVHITEEHMRYCKNLVIKNCNIPQRHSPRSQNHT